MQVSVGIEERGNDKSLAHRIMIRVDLTGDEECVYGDELKSRLIELVSKEMESHVNQVSKQSTEASAPEETQDQESKQE